MKAERKYMMHFLDGKFDTSYTNPEYERIGKDLTEFNVELSPEIETSTNILGENSVKHNGYGASASVSPVYYEYDDALTEKILEIAMLRLTGDACKTSYVEVVVKPGATSADEPTIVRATRQDVLVIPTSYGGDTSGVQVPFTLNFTGNLVEGTWDMKTKTFTANDSGL